MSIIATASSDGTSTSISSNARPKTTVSIGEEGRVFVEGQSVVILAATEEALKEFNAAALANDNIGIAQMIVSGKLFKVVANTKILMLGAPGLVVRKIRITEGESYGQVGFVQADFVKPL